VKPFTVGPAPTKDTLLTDRHLPPGARGVRHAEAPTISVVVASCHELHVLETCLDVLLPQCRQVEAEVVVARVAAADQLQALTRAYPTVRFVSAPHDATMPDLRAAGMAEAEGDVVALTEDHCLMPPDRLTELARASARNPR
jgi:GT2 family glycosyltransferase